MERLLISSVCRGWRSRSLDRSSGDGLRLQVVSPPNTFATSDGHHAYLLHKQRVPRANDPFVIRSSGLWVTSN